MGVKKNKLITQPIYLVLKLKLLALTALGFACIMYLMHFQIKSLSLEIKNLLPLIELLGESQGELKNQLFLKDQQVKALEITVENLKNSVANLSYLNETKNFEVLRDEVIKANTAETAKFYLQLAGITVSFVLVLLLASGIKETLFSEVIELKFVDSVNNLMWLVKIPDNKNADLIIKKIDANDHDQVVEFVKTVVIKTSESFFRGSPDGVELVSSSVPVAEKIIAASQITEILSSTGIY